jgi:hypothetical protein
MLFARTRIAALAHRHIAAWQRLTLTGGERRATRCGDEGAGQGELWRYLPCIVMAYKHSFCLHRLQTSRRLIGARRTISVRGVTPLVKCVFGLALLSACSVDPTPLLVANPDANRFATEAYPILLRDCGFPACHGARDRFFRVFGPGRTRLSTSPDLDPGDPATSEEIAQSYDRARSMIDAKAPERSLLLRKPLASGAGGAGHKGSDSWGRNVYASAVDPNFQTLRAWVFSLGPAQDAGPAR